MSGTIDVKVKLGLSKDKRYTGPSETVDDGYPFWYIEVIGGEDVDKDGGVIGKISSVKLAPTWKQFQDLIRDVKLHELRVDLTRERKKDANNWENAIVQANRESQTKLDDFKIPEIYNEPKFDKQAYEKTN